MSRVPLLDDRADPQLRELADAIRAQRGGKLLNLYRALLHSPEVASGWLALFTAIRQRATLSDRHRELAIMRVAQLNRADYEYRQHLPFARAAGLDGAALEALEDWRDSSAFTPADRAVLEYTEAMTREVQVPEWVYDQVRLHFNPRETVELTATIGGYNLVSRFLEALQVDHED